jgi:hypothetical protein
MRRTATGPISIPTVGPFGHDYEESFEARENAGTTDEFGVPSEGNIGSRKNRND